MPIDRVVAALQAKLPEANEHLAEAREQLAITGLPREGGSQVWSNNPQERLNREIRRHTDVVATAPPSSASSARCSPSRTTNGSNNAATWDSTSAKVRMHVIDGNLNEG